MLNKFNLNNEFDYLYLDGTTEFLHKGETLYSRDMNIRNIDELEIKYTGFFSNLKCITRTELINFLSYLEVDSVVVSDDKFINWVSYFFSLFLNEGILLIFISVIDISELFVIYKNIYISKYQLYSLMRLFNKRITLEIYRLFLSFIENPKIDLKKHKIDIKKDYNLFKNFVLSNVYLFDSQDYGKHYKSFRFPSIFYGGNDYNQMFIVGSMYLMLFEQRLSFLEILEYFIDNLIYNIYNLVNINKNYSFTFFELGSFFKQYSNKFNFMEIGLKKTFVSSALCILPNYSDKIALYINNFMAYFFLLHEIFSFFRYYLFLLKNVLLKTKNYIIIRQLFKFFKKDFNNLIHYFKLFFMSFFSEIKFFIYALYNEFKYFFYKLYLLLGNTYNNKDKKIKNKLFVESIFLFSFKFQAFFLKFFNLLKFKFLAGNIFNVTNITLGMNLFFFNNLKKVSNKLGNLDFFNDFFDYKEINTLVLEKNKMIIMNKIIKNVYLSFFFKMQVYLLFYDNSEFFFSQFLIVDKNYLLFDIFTERSLINFYSFIEVSNVFNKSESMFNNFFRFIKNNFNVSSFFSVFLDYLHYDTFKTIYILFFDFINDKFFPIQNRVKILIEDTFFLLVEEFFGDGFEYLKDDIEFEIRQNFILEGEDRDLELFENIFDTHLEFEVIDDLFPMYFIEDLVSVNFYINEMYFYKFSDSHYSIDAFMPLNVDWSYDYEETKLSPIFDRQFVYYHLNDRKLVKWRGNFMEPMDATYWYDLISASLSADVASMSPNYFRNLMYTVESSILNPNKIQLQSSFIASIDDYYIYNYIEDVIMIYSGPTTDNDFFTDFLDPFSVEGFENSVPPDMRYRFLNDQFIGTEYACFNLNMNFNQLVSFFYDPLDDEGPVDKYYEFENPSEEQDDLIINDPFFATSTEIRSFVLLHEVWAWWNIIGKVYNSSDIDKITKGKLRPRTNEEAHFFSMFTLSGLSSVFKTYFKITDQNEKGVEEELNVFNDKLLMLLNSLGSMNNINFMKLDLFDDTFLSKREEIFNNVLLSEKKRKNQLQSFDYEFFVNHWSSKYSNFFFFIDYIDLVKIMREYEIIYISEQIMRLIKNNVENDNDNILHQLVVNLNIKRDPLKYLLSLNEVIFQFDDDSDELNILRNRLNEVLKNGLSSQMFVYLKRIESGFLDLFRNSVSSMMVSYYSTNKQNKLLFFWEQFIMMSIEIMYSSVDSSIDYELLSEDSNFLTHFYKTQNPVPYGEQQRRSSHHLIALNDPSFGLGDVFDTSTGFEQIDFLISKCMDPEYLLSNGLNMNYSFVEGLFYDIYETHLSFYIDVDELDDFNLTDMQLFRMYEFHDDHILYDDGIDIDIMELYESSMVSDGVFGHEAYKNYSSIDFYDYRLGESYFYYLERMNFLLKTNRSLIYYLNVSFNNILDISNLNESLSNLLFKECNNFFYKKIDGSYSDSMKLKYYSFDSYKLELVYYYIVNMFYMQKKDKFFNIYILKSLLYLYIINFKKLIIPVNMHFFFLIFFFNFFFYLVCRYCKLKKLEVFDIYNLDMLSFYKLFKYMSINIYIFFCFFIKILKSVWYRVKFFKRYGRLFLNFLKDNFFVYFFKYFFFFDFTKMLNSVVYNYKFLELNSSLRSYLSTLNIYKLITNKFILFNDNILYDYVFNNNNFIDHEINNIYVTNSYGDNNKFSLMFKSNKFNKNKYFQYWFYDNNNNLDKMSLSNDLLKIGDVDNMFVDNFDVFKDTEYFDYEDVLDDNITIGNEWYSSDYMMGDLSDTVDDDEDEFFDLEDEFEFDFRNDLMSEEEFVADLELDVGVKQAYGISSFDTTETSIEAFNFDEEEEELSVDTLTDSKFNIGRNLWEYRYHMLYSNFININYMYMRKFILKLLNYYKNVPISEIISTEENVQTKQNKIWLAYLQNNAFAKSIDSDLDIGVYNKGRSAKFNRLEHLLSNKSSFLKNVFHDLNTKDKFDNLIPKYFMTNVDFLDDLDHLIDLNNTTLVDFDNDFDIYDLILGVSMLNYENMFLTLNKNFLLQKLLSYYRFILLYINIYRYIDSKYKKLLFVSFFFFDLNITFFKLVQHFLGMNLFGNNYKYINVFLSIKFIYNKVYMYKYIQLQNFLLFLKNRKNKLLKNSSDYIQTIIFFDFIPIYYENNKFLLKKILLLKSLYGSELSMHSYLLLIKGFDWFFSFINGNKKDFNNFNFFILKKLKYYESFIFLNAYRLAQIYSRYGLVDSYFFFNKMCIGYNILYYKNFMELKYKYLNFFIFSFEFFVFFFFVILFIFLSFAWIDLFYLDLFRNVDGLLEYIGRGYEEDTNIGEAYPFTRRLIDNSLFNLFKGTWKDLWGIF